MIFRFKCVTATKSIEQAIQEARSKLDIIEDVWIHFVWEYSYGRKKVNFNEETKTSYMGDILSYFSDTLALLLKSNSSTKYEDHVFFATGLLQIIYVQQDLISELLYVFKLDTDKMLARDQNYLLNRDIRNELVGHPIRRKRKDQKDDTKQLVSTIIFGNQLNNETINYVRYARKDNFMGADVHHNVLDIVNRHVAFLNEYLDKIIEKLKIILSGFAKNLKKVKKLVNGKIPFKKKIGLAEKQFESIFSQNHLYKKETLLELDRRRDEHIRYRFATRMFINEFKVHLSETIRWCNEVFEIKIRSEIELPIIPQINFTFVDRSPEPIQQKSDYGYELGKLMDNHPIWGINYFKEEFSKSRSIMTELKNMEMNLDVSLEFYASYEYIRKLVLKKSPY